MTLFIGIIIVAFFVFLQRNNSIEVNLFSWFLSLAYVYKYRDVLVVNDTLLLFQLCMGVLFLILIFEKEKMLSFVPWLVSLFFISNDFLTLSLVLFSLLLILFKTNVPNYCIPLVVLGTVLSNHEPVLSQLGYVVMALIGMYELNKNKSNNTFSAIIIVIATTKIDFNHTVQSSFLLENITVLLLLVIGFMMTATQDLLSGIKYQRMTKLYNYFLLTTVIITKQYEIGLILLLIINSTVIFESFKKLSVLLTLSSILFVYNLETTISIKMMLLGMLFIAYLFYLLDKERISG